MASAIFHCKYDPNDAVFKRTATDREIEQHKISEARFRGIMAKADKNYDVEAIIASLSDGTGHIPLNQINLYTKSVQILDDEKEDEL